MVSEPVEVTIRKLHGEGMTVSEIDEMLHLPDGTARRSIVYDWEADKASTRLDRKRMARYDVESCKVAYSMHERGFSDVRIGSALDVGPKDVMSMVKRGERIVADARSWELRNVMRWRWPTIAAELGVSENTARKMARRHAERIDHGDG